MRTGGRRSRWSIAAAFLAQTASLLLIVAVAAPSVGEYVRTHMPASRLEVVTAKGHCLHMTHPVEVAGLIRDFDGNAPARS